MEILRSSLVFFILLWRSQAEKEKCSKSAKYHSHSQVFLKHSELEVPLGIRKVSEASASSS